ncbi:MAG: tetratricopeptide repeat protein [Polyangiaceae bacterium]|nr:tetratricopeptide repeat protein [Polyangiaceae bacterium]
MASEPPKKQGPVAIPRAPLVGRQRELERAEAMLRRCEAERRPLAIVVTGAQGVGKTRLLGELLSPLQRRSPSRFYRGSALGCNGPYALLTALLRERFGLVEGMSVETCKMWVRSQVSALLGDSKIEDHLYFIGQLLDLPFPESPLTRAVRDDALQGKLLRRAVLRQLVEADASAGLAVLWVDDAHEAHPESLDTLAYLLDNAAGPVLLVFSGRSELFNRSEALFRSLEGRYARVDLGPLPPAEARVVLESMLEHCADVAEVLLSSAASLAGGNPMLLERMVRLYIDEGVLVPDSQGKSWKFHIEKLDKARLPLTLDDVVEARLGTLEPSTRRLLERATLMGNVFWLRGLLAIERLGGEPPWPWVYQETEAEALRQRLDELAERDFLLRLPDSTFPGDVEYVFQNSQERERLAQGLSPSEKRRYHQVIADWLAQKPQLRAHEEHVSLLARQLELAGAPLSSALRFLDAGDVARARYANGRAAEYYQRGLDLLGESEAARRIEALHNQGDVLLLLGRIDEAQRCFRQMMTLAWRLDLPSKGGAAYNRLGRLFRDTGYIDEAMWHLEAGMELFRLAEDERGIASSIDDIGKVHWLRGDYDKALAAFRTGLEGRRKLGDARSIALSQNNLGLALQDSGHYREAREAFEQSLTLRRQIGDLLGIVASLNNIGTLAQDEKDYTKALSIFQEALAVAREVGDKNRIALVLTNIGETYDRLGRPEDAEKILKQAEELCDELGDKLGLAEVVRGLGEAYLLQGDLGRARSCIARAVELFAVVRSKAHLGMALRTLGEITAAGGWGDAHRKKSRDYFLQSIQIFREIGNELQEARSCEALARYLDSLPDSSVKIEAELAGRRSQQIFDRLRS